MPRLSVWHTQGVTLAEALVACPTLAGATVLLYTPRRCLVGYVEEKANVRLFDGTAEQAASLDEVFEARCFTTTAELRWLNEANGLGRAALIGEGCTQSDGWEGAAIPCIDTIAHAYQVWGEGTGVAHTDRWGSVSAGRIGTLYLPCGVVGGKQTVVLNAVEYLSTDFPDGNCAVIEERLVGLEAR